MLRILALAVMAVALNGCAGSANTTSERDWQRYYADRTPSSVVVHGCIAKVGPSCRTKIMWHCPTGFTDTCFTPGSTGHHECVSRDSQAECSLRVSMTCPQGFDDGCNNGSSKNHECMPEMGGSPCGDHAQKTCPVGFKDACSDVAAEN